LKHVNGDTHIENSKSHKQLLLPIISGIAKQGA